MDFVITSQQILWICGFIASIWGVVKIFKELKKPSDDLKATVKRHDDLLHKDIKEVKESMAVKSKIKSSCDEIFNFIINSFELFWQMTLKMKIKFIQFVLLYCFIYKI